MKRIFLLVLVFSGILWAALLAQACVKEPTAAFTPSKTDVEIGESVTFTNRSVGATMYFWDFGDGLSSTEMTPCRSYNTAGSYTVSLTARSACGATNETSALITVNAGGGGTGGGDSGDGDDTDGEGDGFENQHQIFTVGGVTFTMKRVPGGTFWMGAQSTNSEGQNYDADAESDESPVHQVTLSSYYMGETEVTQDLWYAVMGQRPTSSGSQWNSTYGIGNNYPAYYISWNDIQSFLTALNAATASQRGNKTFAMPTEAQWEFAARGGNQSHGYKYAGSNTVGNVAWYTDNSGGKTHQVRGKSPNELGLYDMSGNVWEWCKDWYGSYGSGSQSNPTGPSSGSYRVVRGGGWHDDAGCCRVSHRDCNDPDRRGGIGFRLVLLP